MARDSMVEAVEAVEGVLMVTGPLEVLLRRPATEVPAAEVQPTAVRPARMVRETRAAREGIIV